MSLKTKIDQLPSAPTGLLEFMHGYLLGLAFTGTRIESEDNPQDAPLFDYHGDISDCVDPEMEVWDQLSTESQNEILQDCIGFLTSCAEMQIDLDDYAKAGTDFHLTRNHHGAGFWDGDYPDDIGRKLTELSHPYGTAELMAFGDSTTFDIVH